MQQLSPVTDSVVCNVLLYLQNMGTLMQEFWTRIPAARLTQTSMAKFQAIVQLKALSGQ
jgi:hypothetical protein